MIAAYLGGGGRYLIHSCEAAKKTLAVMPLETVENDTDGKVAEIMTEELTAALYNSGRCTVVERNQLASVLN